MNHAKQPLCALALDKKFDFLFGCKPDSHPTLYRQIAAWETAGSLAQLTVRHLTVDSLEVYTYRYANQVPLRAGADALLVNWCEVTITAGTVGGVLYHNALATNHQITERSVHALVRDGRAHWKSENENNNVLKNRGYHLEHNFGHGKQHLSSFLLTLNLLDFLFHTILSLVDEKYVLVRAALAARETFFNDLCTLLRYILLESWEQLLDFMIAGLELVIPP